MGRSDVVGKCERCGKIIYKHDSFETIDDNLVCLECCEESYLEDEDE